MTILDLHERLAAWPEDKREAFPFTCEVECPGGRADAWPALATAGVVLTGWLPTIDNNRDLADAVAQAASLIESGIVTTEQLEEETRGVLVTLLQWGDDQVDMVRPTFPEPSRN